MGIHKDFEVEVVYSGKGDSFGNKWYSFKVFSYLSESMVIDYCMKELRVSYLKKDMPNSFSYELMEFTNNTKLSLEMGNLYQYTIRKASSI